MKAQETRDISTGSSQVSQASRFRGPIVPSYQWDSPVSLNACKIQYIEAVALDS